MKKMIKFAYCCIVLMVGLAVVSCSESLEITPEGNVGTKGTLSFYEWTSPSQIGDTVVLVCNQVLNYNNDNGSQTIYPKAILKLWCKSPSISYAEGTNPTPLFSKGPMTSGYEGINPRCYLVKKDIYLNDGEIFVAELRSEVYSYHEYGREYFFDHVRFDDLLFTSAKLRYEGDLVYPEITFQLVWSISNGDTTEPKTVQASYVKKAVKEVDKLLNTTYAKGVTWLNSNTFCPYVDKIETWQIAGTKTQRNSAPALPFDLTASANKSLDVSNFSFEDVVQPSYGNAENINQDGWNILKRQATQTVMFSNGVESFDDVFSYPVYDISLNWEGQKFSFDVDVDFKVNSSVNIISEQQGQCTSSATAKIAELTFNAQVISSLTLKTVTPPDQPAVGTKKGKILNAYVSAVFDQAGVNTGSIAKKAVVIRYELGYDWGICNYNETFPQHFTFTQTTYTQFNSAAKRSANDAFELAKVVENTTSIFWYNEKNRQISGIDKLTCFMRGWPLINQEGNYASLINTYQTAYSNNDYKLVLTAPNGEQLVIESSPY